MRLRSVAVGCMGLIAASAFASKPAFKLDPKEYMPVSQVRPGMVGYGLTVFRGVKIEKFKVKVVAVMPQQNAGRPLILVMMSGGPITERHANIIAGMSGSPVYINGRLLGAVAYGDSLPKEPLAMITPIQDMVDSFDPNLPTKPSYPVAVPVAPSQAVDVLPVGLSANRLLPLFASGFGGRSLGTLNDWLRPYGIQATAGPGGSGEGNPGYFPKNVKLEPGSAIAVSLMQGDVDLTAIGTVTYRRGDRILAFGHPFLQIGAAEYPASTAYIHDVFSSVSRSYKMGSAIKTVATIQQDQPFSVGGLMHRLPNMVPLTVNVTDKTTGRHGEYHMRLVNHPTLAPGLVVSGTQEVIDRLRAFPGDAMANVKFTIWPEGMAPVSRSNIVFDPGSVSGAATGDVLEAMSIVSRNPFQPIKIQKVEVSVEIENGHRTANIERAWIEKDKVEPGQEVAVQVLVRPYLKPAETRTLRIRIPANASNGQAQVVVFGGMTGFGRISAAGTPTGGAAVGGSASVANAKQLIEKFTERERNDDLAVHLLMPGSVVAVEGQRLVGLPDPLADVMKSTKASGSRLERDELRTSVRLPYVISGQQVLTLNIERKTATEKGTAASSTTTTSTTSSSASSDTSDDNSDTAAAIQSSYTPYATFGGKPGESAVAAAPKKPDAKPADDKTGGAKPDAGKPADGKPADAKPADAKPEDADADKDGKGPGRMATVWKQATRLQFESGDLTNVSVSSTGDVSMTASITRVADATRPYVWSVLPLPDGSTLLGTGHGGEILSVDAGGKSTVVADTDDLEILSLVQDAQGGLYAGTGPGGHILHWTAGGKPAKFFDTGERYVLALGTGKDGTVYAATGPNGRVFAVTPDGKGKQLVQLPETNVTSLAVTKDGDLIVGTAPDGLVYRITPKGDTSVVFDAAEPTITAVAVNTGGQVFAASAPGGKVYKVQNNGRGDVLVDKADGAVLGLAATSDGTLFAAAGRKVYRVSSDKTVTVLDNEDQNQFLSLAIAADGTLRLGSGNTGALYRSQLPANGTYTSPVHDAGLRAVWGRMEWQSETPEGAKVSIQTRTGNAAQPDSTWSDWSAPLVSPKGSPIASPPARFAQYRAILTSAPDGTSPILRWATIRYLTDNRPPTVKITEPKEADVWSGKKTVKWTGSDPDSDQLTYTLYASSDNGTTWKALNTAESDTRSPDVKTTEPVKPPTATDAAAKDARNAETMKRVNAELDKYTDMASDVKAAVQQTAEAGLKASSKDLISSDKASGDIQSKSSYTWDTSTTPDGEYVLKVVATDKPSNPVGFLSDEDKTMVVTVVNTKPAVTIAEKDNHIGTDLSVTVHGSAKTGVADIVRVSYRVDKGSWMAAIAQDGMFDQPTEDWRVVTDPLTKGDHTIEVKVTDEADNSTSATTKVTIP